MQDWWSIAWPQLVALVVALVSAWIVYRLQRREERKGVLASLDAELELHKGWVGGVPGYTRETWRVDDWFKDPETGEPDWHKIVYKLSTVATDNAIQVGPALFINRGLVAALVMYKQRAAQFNQLIDDMAAFRGSPELWLDSPQRDDLRQQLKLLAGMVHMSGIADDKTFPYGANHAYHVVTDSLRAERTESVWRQFWWFLLGITHKN